MGITVILWNTFPNSSKIYKFGFRVYILICRDVNRVKGISPGFLGNWRDVEDVKRFLLYYFLSARRNTEKALYHHFTVAVDTNNIRIVFKDVKDTILKKNLDALLLQ